MANTIDFKIRYTSDRQSLEQVRESIRSIQELTAHDLVDLNKGLNLQQAQQNLVRLQSTARELGEVLDRSFNADLGTLNITRFNQELRQLDINKLYRDLSSAGAAGRNLFNSMTTQALTTNMQLKSTNKLLENMGETLKNTIRWSISSTLLNSFTGSFERAYGYVKNLDRTLNDIRIVTGKSAEDMAEFAVQANKASQQMATRTTDYTAASLIYYQQGLSDEEVEARTETTLKAANVTQQNTEEVSEQLTSVWNGYRVSAQEAELYVDKLAAVAATTASNLEELSTGMSRVASAANLMGVDIDQMNALLSTAISVTRQSPETIGAGFKSIFSRISDIKNNEGEMTLGNYAEKMHSLGVDILDTNDKLRDMGSIIEEVGDGWSNMGKEQQVALAKVMGGTYQYSRLLAVFENWDKYKDALKTSSEAVGTLQEQQDIYLEGTQGKLKILTATVEDLYDSMLNSNAIESVVEGFTALLKNTTTFVDAIGGGETVLLTLGMTASQVFNGQIAKGISNAIINFIGFRENLNKIKIEMQTIQTLRGLNIPDESFQTIIRLKESFQSYSHLMSEEQNNQANSIIKTVAQLEAQEAQWIENRDAVAAYFEAFGIGHSNFENMTRNEVSQYNRELRRNARNFQTNLDETRNFQTSFNAMSSSRQMMGNTTGTAREDYSQQYEQSMERVRNLLPNIIEGARELRNNTALSVEEQRELNAALEAYEQSLVRVRKGTVIQIPQEELERKLSNTRSNINQAVRRVAEVSAQAQESLVAQSNQNLQRVEQLSSTSIQNIRSQAASVTDSITGMLRNLEIENMVRRFTTLATTAGQVGMAFSSMSTMIKTLKNDEATFGEKLSTVMMNLGFTIPSLVTSMHSLNEVFGTTNILIGFRNALQEQQVAAVAKSVIANNTLNVSLVGQETAMTDIVGALQAEAVARGISIGALSEESATRVILNATEGTSIALSESEAASLYKLIVAQNARTSATGVATAAQQAFNASLLANPIVQIGFALGGLIGIIHLVTKAQEENIEAQKKANDETIKEAEELQKENESIKDLHKTYQEALSSYEKTGEGKDKLIEATEALNDATGAEIKKNQMLADSYDLVNQKISKAEQKKTSEALKKTESQVEAQKENILFDYAPSVTKIDEIKQQAYDTRALSIKGSILSSTDNPIQNYLEEELSKIGDFDFERFGRNLEISGIQGIQDLRKIYKAFDKAIEGMREDIPDNIREDSTLWNNLQNIQKSLGKDLEKLKDYKKAEKELIIQSSIQEVDMDTDFSEIKGLKSFEKYRQSIIDSVSNAFKDNDLEGSQKDIIEIVDDYLMENTVGDLNDYAIKSSFKESLVKNLDASEEDIRKFIKKLEEDDELSVALSLTVDKGESLDSFKEKIKNAIDEANEATVRETSGMLSSGDLIDDLQSGDLNFRNAEDNEDWVAITQNLEKLKNTYPELTAAVDVLNEKWLIGSQMYFEALEQVQDALHAIDMSNMRDGIEEMADTIQETIDDESFDVSIEADVEEFTNQMDALLDKQYELDIAIHAEAEQEFDSITHAMDDIYEKAGLIGESFVVDADKIRELNNTFPGIVEGMTALADGSIQLNEKVAASAINAAEAEVHADTRAAIEKLENQERLLRKKQAVYHRMAQAAFVLANQEEATEEQVSKAKEKLSHGLNRIKKLNDKAAAQSQMDNAQLVAENDRANAGASLASWNEAEQKKTIANARWARNAIINSDAVKQNNYEMVSEGGAWDTNYQGATGVSGEAGIIEQTQTMIDNGGTSQDWASLGEKLKMLEGVTGAAANDIRGMIAELGSRANKINTGFNNVRAGNGITPNADEEVKEEKVKDPDFMEYLEEERDRYYEINLQIERLNRNLNKVEKQQDKLYGKKLINNLNKQLQLLEKQNQAYKTKLAIAQTEKKELRKGLKGSGVSFGEGGMITNYNEALQSQLNYVNTVIAQYNSMSAEQQESFKSVVEAAKKGYDQFKERLDRYTTLVSEEIPDLKESIQDNLDKEIEIKIKKFTMAVEIRLEMGEAERDYNEFRRKVVDGLRDDDILGNAKYKLKDYQSYFKVKSGGEIQSLTTQVNRTIDQIRQINKTGTSSFYGDNKAQALEDLKKYTDLLMDKMEELKDLQEEIRQSYLDIIDKATEAFDEQVDTYGLINDQLEHNQNLIGLLYGDQAYDKMATYYNKIEENNNKQLDFLRQRAALAKQRYEQETDPDAKKKWKEEYTETISELNQQIEKSIQDLQDKYKNGISNIFKTWENSITNGKGLDFTKLEWDMQKENEDMFLDEVNSIYEYQKLASKYQEAINDADGLGTQQKLNDLMEDQLGMLREKDKLTQYDIDRANKAYEIALKEAALQESQQNKSKMRLRRDAQGNYSFQYVSDEDSIAKIRQEISDLYNDLYNFDQDALENNHQKALNSIMEFEQKIAEIMSDTTKSEEQRLAEAQRLNELYQERMLALTGQNETIKGNLQESTFAALADEYNKDETKFKEIADERTTDFAKLTQGMEVSFLGLNTKNTEAFREFTSGMYSNLLGELVPAWDNGVQQMINKISGPNGFGEQSDEIMNQILELTREYDSGLEELANNAGRNFDDICNGYDQVSEYLGTLLQNNDDLIESYEEELAAIDAVCQQLQKLIDKYKESAKEALNAIEASQKWQQNERDKAANAAEKDVEKNIGSSTTTVNFPGVNKDIFGNTGTFTKPAHVKDNIPQVGDIGLQFKQGGVYYTSSDGKKSKKANLNTRYYLKSINQGALHEIELVATSRGNKVLHNMKPIWTDLKYITGYDTGGYTGSWSSQNGKLAVLHEKELVLNKKDTENILNAVNTVRDMDAVMNNIQSNIVSRVAGLLSGLSSFVLPKQQDLTVDQKVQIEANFPNVQNSSEIENAFNNLINIASQRAYNNKR